jgi:hypothetical protein
MVACIQPWMSHATSIPISGASKERFASIPLIG